MSEHTGRRSLQGPVLIDQQTLLPLQASCPPTIFVPSLSLNTDLILPSRRFDLEKVKILIYLQIT